MTKRITAYILIISLLLMLAGCRPNPYAGYVKYSDSFFDSFDTWTQVVAYTKSEEEFNQYFEQIHNRFQEQHKLYDIYNTYEGINNIKTINDQAGKQPVKVDQEIIDLILFSKEWYQRTGGKMNIAMGSVLKIWHDYRTEGLDMPEKAALPPLEMLEAAAQHTDINQVNVNE